MPSYRSGEAAQGVVCVRMPDAAVPRRSSAAVAGAGEETGCVLNGFDVSGDAHGAVVTPPAGGGQWGGLPIRDGPPHLCWPAGMDDKAVVTVGDQRFELASSEVLTFGRDPSCAVCLDPDDLGISRLAGSIEQDAATWWVLNRSTVRPLEVVDDIGIRTVVAPGRRLAVFGPLTVVVEGSVRRHALALQTGLSVPAPAGAPAAAGNDDPRPTVTAAEVVINDQDRLALVALFAGYLEPFPRYDPHPRSYADAAARLGWPWTTLVKRIEYLRTRLTDAGVPNLQGENALPALAEWALLTRSLTRQDLDLLPGR